MSPIHLTSLRRLLLASVALLGSFASARLMAQAQSVTPSATGTAADQAAPAQNEPSKADQSTEAKSSTAPGGLFFLSSPLQRAIRRGMRPGGDLAAELREFEYYEISSKKDARAICEALKQLPLQLPPTDDAEQADDKAAADISILRALTSLFENIESFEVPAFAVLRDEGIPQLARVYDAMLASGPTEDSDHLLYALEIMTMYESPLGAERIVGAVRAPLAPDSQMWTAVFEMVAQDTTYRDSIYRSLSETPPSGFAAVALLDSANEQAVEGHLPRHPFNSAAGAKRLAELLEDSDPEGRDSAQSATTAIAFLEREYQDQLLKIAEAHPNELVRLEAGWAAAKLGRESGLDVLKQFSLDVNHSATAVKYLEELKRGDLIPSAVNDPGFRARAELAQWLADPSELGRSPDEVTVVEHRELKWPPEKELKPFWIVRFRSVDPYGLADDQSDVGVVGSHTWVFFGQHMSQRPPEDIYAIHCAWELAQTELIEASVVDDPAVFAPMLAQWTAGGLESARIEMLAKLSDELNYGSKRVAIATALRDGQMGWVVLDGPRSAWYAKSEQPENTGTGTVLWIHLGRHLLGLLEPVDRTKFLTPPSPGRPAQEIIAAYEKLMKEFLTAKPTRQRELLSWSGPLSENLDRYVTSVAEVRGGRPEEVRVGAYTELLRMALESDPSIRSGLLRGYSFLGLHFESYVDACLALGRQEEVAAMVERLAGDAEFDLDLDVLGKAAFKVGRRDLAERLLDKYREESKEYHFSESMTLLAEIWHERGEPRRARDLLLDCLRKLAKDIQEGDYDYQQEEMKRVFEQYRSTFLKLFPDGAAELPQLEPASVEK
ncbi:MAG: hypothetical protein U0795_23115 [Pirellulales bacterium]